jgi:hypothetical protein
VVRQRVKTQAAQIGRQEQRDKAVPACPTHDVRQTGKTLQIQNARGAHERGRRHPVGRRGHAVVHGRYLAPRHVVLALIGSTAPKTNAGIGADGHDHEAHAYPGSWQASALGPRHASNKCQKAQREAAVAPMQRAHKLACGGIHRHAAIVVNGKRWVWRSAGATLCNKGFT